MMGTLFMILIFWIAFSYIIAPLIPPLLRGVWCVVLFICRVHVVSVYTLIKTAFWLLSQLAQRGLRPALIFALLFVQELWADMRGAAAADTEDNHEEPGAPAPDASSVDPYAQAIALFGLQPGFTRASFTAAYRQAMKTAHPDTGGSTREAQALNQARDLLMRAHGWA